VSNLRTINNWDYGAALKVKSYLYHTEFQHDLTSKFLAGLDKHYRLNLMYGFDFRNYIIIPDGNYFINPESPGKNLQYWKVGGFVQATKYFVDDKIKINAVLRIDKNQYFDPKLNPRISIVYTPEKKHNFRASFQQGYRFPSLFEAFSNINSGGVKRVGGLPVMSNGIFENSYLRSSIDAFQSAVTNDVNKNGLSTSRAIANNQSLLKKNSYTYLQPEKVTSFEIGYRTELLNGNLYLDMDFYYNIYNNLIAQVEANIPKSSNPDSLTTYLNDKKKQDRYRLWTNSKTITYNYGGTFGLTAKLPRNYKLAGNITHAKLNRKSGSDGLEDGFNTPEWIYNLSFNNPVLYKNLGFNVNYRWQKSFLWQSSLATGNVPAYSKVDLQLQYLINKNLNVKIGASNLFNQYYESFIGGPSVGGFYYCTLTVGFI
ncbi:MAG: TonB-dependent receptor, partial [Opitutaceae bacterium]|nr:TonB-dependent receptor [Cytophagales bacterium]